jgi:hypothetical protein
MSRPLSTKTLAGALECPVKGGKPDPETHVDSRMAQRLTLCVPSTLYTAVSRGELTLFHHGRLAYWSREELVAWASREARKARRSRAGAPKQESK